MEGELTYPLIAIAGIGELEVHREPSTLTTSYAKRVRLGWYRGMQLISSDLRQSVVRSATVLGGVGPFWGFSLTYSRRVRLALEIDSPREISLQECKAVVTGAMAKAPHFWQSAVAGPSLTGWQRCVREAPDLATIIHTIEARELAA